MESSQTLPAIYVTEFTHREKEVLGLEFSFDKGLQELVKQIAGRTFSKTHRLWYFEKRPGLLKEIEDVFSGKALIKAEGLGPVVLPAITEVPVVKQAPSAALAPLTDKHVVKIEAFRRWMRSRRYSENTIGTYVDALGTFLRYFSGKEIEDLNNEDLIDFNNDYILQNRFSASYQNQVVNAVKLFFRTVEKKSLSPELIERPKRAKTLPNVLSKEEVKLILGALRNIKHKAMLSLIYACGLRRGELLNLQLRDVDSKRGLIIVRQAKGKKDRVAPLSEKIVLLLREYYVAYNPKYWLFEGQDGTSQYDERSLGNVLKLALEKSKIDKPVTLHWLRHSYATHLLESGTDLRYIQEILGHSRSTTTEIYTHVSNHNIQRISSPFDSL